MAMLSITVRLPRLRLWCALSLAVCAGMVLPRRCRGAAVDALAAWVARGLRFG